jgi:hypothetical protein
VDSDDLTAITRLSRSEVAQEQRPGFARRRRSSDDSYPAGSEKSLLPTGHAIASAAVAKRLRVPPAWGKSTAPVAA